MSWDRGSRHARGYGTQWDRARKYVLRRDMYLCQCDQCKGGQLRLRPATEVDHRIPKAQGGTDELTNLAAINKECHKRKTMLEQGRPLRPRGVVGVDGWPGGIS